MKSSLGLVSLLMGAASAAPAPLVLRSINATVAPEAPKLPLIPIPNTSRVPTAGRNIAPTSNLNLAWQTPDNASVVAVALNMQHPAVVLEDVDDVTAVDCTGQASVAAEKKDVYSTAKSTEIDFNNVATPVSDVDKRGISFNKEGLTIAYNYSLPSEQTIVNVNDISVVLHEAQIQNSVTYGGHVKWELFDGVTEFTIDIDKSMFHQANLTFGTNVKLSQTWSWAPEPLTYSVIDVPGILSLGPSAGVSFGGEISASTGGSITGDFTSSMPNGSIHLDFINWDQSTSTGWETDHDASFRTSENVKVTLKPFVDFTVEFACNLFDGLLDLSTGVKAQPSFPFITAATATQDLNSTGTMSFPNATCANGLSETIQFEFAVSAFATEFVSATLYDYKTDLYKGCINF
ncbi:hypothetical protein VSDG_09191 [Cytospora chrysosperma]|uniref:Peptidase A1 domain-containing protein n=1 Tax=Cytospora chrysosperma TaxID=252740 RepID=A0A423VAV2_CYTCH|nr:hypothetical protein VSDG_09191 [Valsa sordida]